jgi:hypothetical protein
MAQIPSAGQRPATGGQLPSQPVQKAKEIAVKIIDEKIRQKKVDMTKDFVNLAFSNGQEIRNTQAHGR